MQILKYFWALISFISILSNPVLADRLKDLTSLAGVRSNQLVGYGVVVGLAGTGDGNTGITLQSMQSLVSRFGVTSEVEGLNGDNSAAVMITADLPHLQSRDRQLTLQCQQLEGLSLLREGLY